MAPTTRQITRNAKYIRLNSQKNKNITKPKEKIATVLPYPNYEVTANNKPTNKVDGRKYAKVTQNKQKELTTTD